MQIIKITNIIDHIKLARELALAVNGHPMTVSDAQAMVRFAMKRFGEFAANELLTFARQCKRDKADFSLSNLTYISDEAEQG